MRIIGNARTDKNEKDRKQQVVFLNKNKSKTTMILTFLITLLFLIPSILVNVSAPDDGEENENLEISTHTSRTTRANYNNTTDFSDGSFDKTRIDINNNIGLDWEQPKKQYVMDSDTLVLNHFENSPVGEDNEKPDVYSRSYSGLAGLWKFDEGTGGTAFDSSGNNNHGTITSATWTKGLFGNALNFDNTDDYVNCGSGASLDITGTAITIEGWINPNKASGSYKIVSKWSGVNGYMFGFFNDQHRFYLGTGNNVNLMKSIGNYELKTWHYHVATYDGTIMKLYVDGEMIGSMGMTSSIATSAAVDLWIGRYHPSPSSYFDGKIDEVAIYGRPKTAEEVKRDYLGYLSSVVSFSNGKFGKGLEIDEKSAFGLPVGAAKEDNLTGLWRFNEGSGTSTKDGSGNGNPGTLNGSTWAEGRYGKAMKFDGTDDSVDLNYIPNTFNRHDFTISAWVIPNSTAYLVIYGVGDEDAPDKTFLFGLNTGRVFAIHWFDNWYSNIPIKTNEWSYITYVYTDHNKEGKIYVNGIYQQSYTFLGYLDVQDDSYGKSAIGAFRSSSNFFNGAIDEVTIYNRVRTPHEILSDYTASGQINFNPNQGTIEMFVKPDWNGNDGINHTLFFSGNSTDNNSFFIYKNTANKLVVKTSDNMSNSQNNPSVGIGSWKKDTWYHVAFTWDSGTKEIYIDGKLEASTDNNLMPSGYYSKMYIGTHPNGTFYGINGTIDELRISDVVRSPDDFRQYYPEGFYESSVFDANETVDWEMVSWSADVPMGTVLQLQTSTSQDNLTWTNWTGSTMGSSGEFFYTDSDGESILGEHSRFLRWRAIMKSVDGGFTPVLKSLNITWNFLPKVENVTLTPLAPTVLNNLMVSYNYLDADNDTEGDTKVEWYVDRGVGFINIGVNNKTLAHKWLQVDDEWYCKITPHDGKTYGLPYETSPVTIVAGPIVRIELTPKNVTISTEDEVKFTAKAFDEKDNEISTSFEWNATGGGEIDQQGNFVAAATGVHGVSASSDLVSGYAVVIIEPGNMNNITIIPTNPEISTDDFIQFEAIVQDAKNNMIHGLSKNWSVSGGGNINPKTGFFEANKPGAWIVTVNVSGTFANTNLIIRQGKVKEIDIVTQNPTVTADDEFKFIVQGYDDDGNLIELPAVWEVENGKVLPDGSYIPDEEGTWEVTVTIPGTDITAKTTITVNYGAVFEVKVDPKAHLMKVNESKKFTASVIDSKGNEWSDSSNISWEISDLSKGIIDADGTFHAKKAGEVTINAKFSTSENGNGNGNGNGNNTTRADDVIGSATVTILEDITQQPDPGKKEKKEKEDEMNMGLLIVLIILIIIIVLLFFLLMRKKSRESAKGEPRRRRREREEEELEEEREREHKPDHEPEEEEEEWEKEAEEEEEPVEEEAEAKEEAGGWEVVDEEEEDEDQELEDIDVGEDEEEEQQVPAKGKIPKGKFPKQEEEDFWD